jgi:hypothetical protein
MWNWQQIWTNASSGTKIPTAWPTRPPSATWSVLRSLALHEEKYRFNTHEGEFTRPNHLKSTIPTSAGRNSGKDYRSLSAIKTDVTFPQALSQRMTEDDRQNYLLLVSNPDVMRYISNEASMQKSGTVVLARSCKPMSNTKTWAYLPCMKLERVVM